MRKLNTEGTELDKDPLTSVIVGCAIEVHRYLGIGLPKCTYQRCMEHELRLRDVQFTAQQSIPVYHKGINLDCGYRADIIVENCVVVELKVIERVAPIHCAQLLTYMKHAETPVGLLINFYEKRLKDGIKRFVL